MTHVFASEGALSGPQRLDPATLCALFAASHVARWALGGGAQAGATVDPLSARIALFAGAGWGADQARGRFRLPEQMCEGAVNLGNSGDGKAGGAQAPEAASASAGPSKGPGSI